MDIPDISKLYRTQVTEKCFKNRWTEYYNYVINKYKDIHWDEGVYLDQHNMSEPPKCPVCGKKCLFISIYKGYRTYCSKECGYKSKGRIEKIKNTMKIRYGTEYALQSKYCKEKRRATLITKYGDSSYNNRPKMKQTCISRYGGVGSASETIKQKVFATWKNNRIKDNLINGQVGYADNGEWIIKCGKDIKCPGCNGTFSIKSGNYLDRKRLGYELCTKINPINRNKTSDTRLEVFIKNLLDNNNINYICNDRTIIHPKELDIYIPNKQLAIECNGCQWHSYKEPKYHINKFVSCKQKNIQLLTIWEDWINNKPDIVKSIICAKLGIISNKIYARKCIIKSITSKICNAFLDNNHILGKCNASIRYGLYYNNELVSVMCFSSRKNSKSTGTTTNREWELIRFCNKINTIVIGAASKLLNHFIIDINPSAIISFSCDDISDGNIYNKLGFTTNSHIINTYWYVHKNNFTRYHRTKFTKSALQKMGIDISNKTEGEIMKILPYWRIHDSGMVKWVLLL